MNQRMTQRRADRAAEQACCSPVSLPHAVVEVPHNHDQLQNDNTLKSYVDYVNTRNDVLDEKIKPSTTPIRSQEECYYAFGKLYRSSDSGKTYTSMDFNCPNANLSSGNLIGDGTAVSKAANGGTQTLSFVHNGKQGFFCEGGQYKNAIIHVGPPPGMTLQFERSVKDVIVNDPRCCSGFSVLQKHAGYEMVFRPTDSIRANTLISTSQIDECFTQNGNNGVVRIDGNNYYETGMQSRGNVQYLHLRSVDGSDELRIQKSETGEYQLQRKVHMMSEYQSCNGGRLYGNVGWVPDTGTKFEPSSGEYESVLGVLPIPSTPATTTVVTKPVAITPVTPAATTVVTKPAVITPVTPAATTVETKPVVITPVTPATTAVETKPVVITPVTPATTAVGTKPVVITPVTPATTAVDTKPAVTTPVTPATTEPAVETKPVVITPVTPATTEPAVGTKPAVTNPVTPTTTEPAVDTKPAVTTPVTPTTTAELETQKREAAKAREAEELQVKLAAIANQFREKLQEIMGGEDKINSNPKLRSMFGELMTGTTAMLAGKAKTKMDSTTLASTQVDELFGHAYKVGLPGFSSFNTTRIWRFTPVSSDKASLGKIFKDHIDTARTAGLN